MSDEKFGCDYRIIGYEHVYYGFSAHSSFREVFTACALKLDTLRQGLSERELGSESLKRRAFCPYGGLGQISIEGCGNARKR